MQIGQGLFAYLEKIPHSLPQSVEYPRFERFVLDVYIGILFVENVEWQMDSSIKAINYMKIV